MSGTDTPKGPCLWRSYVKNRTEYVLDVEPVEVPDAEIVVLAIAATEAAVVRAGMGVPILTRAELAAEVQRVLGLDELEQRIGGAS